MKKSTVKKYNWIAFVIVPAIIVLSTTALCVWVVSLWMEPTINYDQVTSQTESGELWKVLEVTEGEYVYVVYSAGNSYQLDNEHLIAFQGPSIEEITNTIEETNPGGNGITSYWEGDGGTFDFSTTYDFEVYLEEVESTVYYNYEPDPEVITANFSKVELYDVSDYIGFERHNNAGVLMGIMFSVAAIVFWPVIILGVELLVALILKLTVFQMKKAQ